MLKLNGVTIEMTGNIIFSLLDLDFYKLTMMQAIWKRYANAPVKLGFINRTKKVLLAERISESELRAQLDHVCTITFKHGELEYLRNLDGYPRGMFCAGFLEYLRTFNLKRDSYKLAYKDGQIELEFSGNWVEVTLWETLALSIINELYYRAQLKTMTQIERDQVFARGIIKLGEKINTLIVNPSIILNEFGTRRRFSAAWQDYVVKSLAQSLSRTQFIGTSNVLLAMKYGLIPRGTNAHELQMVIAAMMEGTDESLRESVYETLRMWWQQYGETLSIVLPDTFGSDYVLRTLPLEVAVNWRGFRHDSGCPFEFGEKVIQFYEMHGINPMDKTIIYSDGLDLEAMLRIRDRFKGRINFVFGWGTNLTNDMGFSTLSLVVKVLMAFGKHTVKLSDNLAKAMGPDEVRDRYTQVFEYHVKFSEQPKV